MREPRDAAHARACRSQPSRIAQRLSRVAVRLAVVDAMVRDVVRHDVRPDVARLPPRDRTRYLSAAVACVDVASLRSSVWLKAASKA